MDKHTSENSQPVDREKSKENDKNGDFKRRIVKIGSTLDSLEKSILESNENDRYLLSIVQRDNLRNQKLAHQLDEARNENKLLLNTLQLKGDDRDFSKSRCQVDYYLSSCSTISMVHLQYKYEELLSSHEGLLRVLESKVKESQKCYRENEELRGQIEKLSVQISDSEKTITTLCDKYLKLKQRKDAKIIGLMHEIEKLESEHRAVNLFTENDRECENEMEEINLCNELQDENLRLLRENKILKDKIKQLSRKSNKRKKNDE